MSDIADMSEEPSAGGGGFLNYIPTILWQRKWLVIVPFVLLSIAGVATALMLPRVYRSSATLLVESQELPSTLVTSPMNTIIDQRIAKIREQVLSRGDLIELIEQNNLYEKERQSKPLSSIVQKMQEETKLQAVSGDLGGQTAQPGGTSTIAFSMSFDYSDPAKAQAVMQSFVSRFLEIDATTMAEQANNTVDFLQDQSRKLNDEINRIESQITAIKARNGSALAGGGGMVAPSNAAGYSVQIAQLQTENRMLMAQVRRTGGKDPIVANAETALVAARAVFAESHPDVVRAKEQLKQAQEIAASRGPTQDSALIQSQIQANNAQIAQLEQARAQDSARAASGLAAQSRAPVVLEEISQLEARESGLRDQLRDISGNVLRAQNSARMAQEQKGERLSVVDPPSIPDKPVSPNRPLLIGGGIGGGLALGIVLALAVELLFRPIRGVGQLQALGLETLALVPTFVPDLPPGERKRRRFPFLPRLPRLPGRKRTDGPAPEGAL